MTVEGYLGNLLDIIDRVWGLHLESDGLARQSFNENLHIYLYLLMINACFKHSIFSLNIL